jgi:hypothetical protein
MYGPSDAAQAIFDGKRAQTRAALMVPKEFLILRYSKSLAFIDGRNGRLQQNAVASRANDGLHCLMEALREEGGRRKLLRKLVVVLFCLGPTREISGNAAEA